VDYIIVNSLTIIEEESFIIIDLVKPYCFLVKLIMVNVMLVVIKMKKIIIKQDQIMVIIKIK